MAGKPYIDDDPFDEPPGKRDEDIDTGPLTLLATEPPKKKVDN